jgi:hypothetical protein
MQVHSQIGERIVEFLVPTLKPGELMKQSRSMVPTKHWGVLPLKFKPQRTRPQAGLWPIKRRKLCIFWAARGWLS